MTATINVNLKPCHCPHAKFNKRHWEDCPAGDPVPIPCPIPRSVTFEVVLGECVEALKTAILPSAKSRCGLTSHHERCPARPIRVSCTIGGDGTWAGSEVHDAAVFVAPPRTLAIGDEDVGYHRARASWTLVKAILLDLTAGPTAIREDLRPLIAQRDAVFTALADVARLEERLFQRGNDAMRAINGHSYMRPEPHDRESASTLARYVARIIEQVGNL